MFWKLTHNICTAAKTDRLMMTDEIKLGQTQAGCKLELQEFSNRHTDFTIDAKLYPAARYRRHFGYLGSSHPHWLALKQLAPSLVARDHDEVYAYFVAVLDCLL